MHFIDSSYMGWLPVALFPYRFPLLSEKLEEIKTFHSLKCLDLFGCRLGDSHDIFQHLTSDALSRYEYIVLLFYRTVQCLIHSLRLSCTCVIDPDVSLAGRFKMVLGGGSPNHIGLPSDTAV